jgi:Tfp pilus assembly protein PilW
MKDTPQSPLLSAADGFTLIELIIAAAMGVAVTAAAVSLLITALHQQPRITDQADAVGEARVAMDRIIRDVRQGSTVVATPTAEKMTLTTYIHATSCTAAPSASAVAIQCKVMYECKSGTCTRRVTTNGVATEGTAATLVSGLSSNEVFSYSPSATAPTYIGVKLALPASKGSNTTTLEDGAALRNAATNLAA